jgi:hypothetical protein
MRGAHYQGLPGFCNELNQPVTTGKQKAGHEQRSVPRCPHSYFCNRSWPFFQGLGAHLDAVAAATCYSFAAGHDMQFDRFRTGHRAMGVLTQCSSLYYEVSNPPGLSER